MAEKQYINGIWIREKKFDNGGSVLNLSVKREEIPEICATLTKSAAESGWARLVIANRKTPDEKSTHTMFVDTFQPMKKAEAAKPETTPEPPKDDSQVPF